MLNFYPSGVPHITGHWCIVPIMLLKASVFRACYRTGQCLPLCNSGLFNSQVSLETLLDFQIKVPRKRAVSISLLQSLPDLHLEADASTTWILCSSFYMWLCIVGCYALPLNCVSYLWVWKHWPNGRVLVWNKLATGVLEFREISANTPMIVTEKFRLDETTKDPWLRQDELQS